MKLIIPEELRKKAEAESKKREKIHKNHSTSRPLSEGYEYIGLLGECGLHLFLGVEIDWALRPSGDGKKDFIYKKYSLDIKTARKPYNLIREIDKEIEEPHSDILILAGIDQSLIEINLIGWEYDEKIIQQPFKDFGYGVINHYMPAGRLRKMEDLLNIKEMNSVKFVPANGTCESGLMIVGEAPGETEDKEGRPFCGRAGKLLDKMLDYIELNRENVYITNCVKVRPINEYGQNRTPTDEELESWKSLLIREINEIKPKVILSLGSCATRTLLNTTEGITKLRGKDYSAPKYLPLYHWECVIIPTYHPAYLLRKSGDKEINDQVKKDLKSVRKVLNL